jgi:hypothetical protein
VCAFLTVLWALLATIRSRSRKAKPHKPIACRNTKHRLMISWWKQIGIFIMYNFRITFNVDLISESAAQWMGETHLYVPFRQLERENAPQIRYPWHSNGLWLLLEYIYLLFKSFHHLVSSMLCFISFIWNILWRNNVKFIPCRCSFEFVVWTDPIWLRNDRPVRVDCFESQPKWTTNKSPEWEQYFRRGKLMR